MNIENGHEPGVAAPDDQSVEQPADTDKTFAGPRAAYALKGHNPHRADPDDSSTAYWANAGGWWDTPPPSTRRGVFFN